MGLDRAIAAYDLMTFRRELGAASASAAGASRDQWLGKDFVEAGDQRPRPSVGHAHQPACRSDRPVFVDQLQQADLAGSDLSGVIEVDAKGEPCHPSSIPDDARVGLMAWLCALVIVGRILRRGGHFAPHHPVLGQTLEGPTAWRPMAIRSCEKSSRGTQEGLAAHGIERRIACWAATRRLHPVSRGTANPGELRIHAPVPPALIRIAARDQRRPVSGRCRSRSRVRGRPSALTACCRE